MNDVERVVRSVFDAENAYEVEKMLSPYSDDVLFEDVPFGIVAKGKEQLREELDWFFDAVPDARTELKFVFSSGDWAAAEWVLSGTQKGDFPGLPATGRSFTARGVTIFKVERGKVKKRTDHWDGAAMLRQVGATNPKESWTSFLRRKSASRSK